MPHFDIDSRLNGASPGVIPSDGYTDWHGPSTTGAHAYQRSLIQFMTGAPVVDYGSIVTTTLSGNGFINAIDTRAGARGVTTGKPLTNLGETWTVAFLSDLTFTVTGSTFGALGGVHAVDGHVEQTDTLYLYISSGSQPWVGSASGVAAEVTATSPTVNVGDTSKLRVGQGVSGAEIPVATTILSIIDDVSIVISNPATTTNATATIDMDGDTIVFTTVTNPNNPTSSPGTQWTDLDADSRYMGVEEDWFYPELQYGNTGSSSYRHFYGYSPLFIDSGGSNAPEEFVYMRISVYENLPSAMSCIYYEGMTGYHPEGTHPNISSGRYTFLSSTRETSGHFMCDQFRIMGAAVLDNQWTAYYVGLIDSWHTTSEYAYPMLVSANDKTAYSYLSNSSYHADLVRLGDRVYNAETFGNDGIWREVRQTGTGEATTNLPGLCIYTPLTNNSNGVDKTYNTYSYFQAPRAGNNQIPVFPITVGSRGKQSTTNGAIGNVENSPNSRDWHGQMRGLFAVPISAVGEGDILQINGVSYLCIRGRYCAATGDRFFRSAIKLS